MSEIVNLNKARKARDKAVAGRRAAANRITHGLSKRARETARLETERDRLSLDAHRREPSDDQTD